MATFAAERAALGEDSVANARAIDDRLFNGAGNAQRGVF